MIDGLDAQRSHENKGHGEVEQRQDFAVSIGGEPADENASQLPFLTTHAKFLAVALTMLHKALSREQDSPDINPIRKVLAERVRRLLHESG